MTTPVEKGTADLPDVRGFWIKQNGRDVICWQINGEFITDKALRSWIYHNNPNAHDHFVGTCILKWHTDQYANRDRSSLTGGRE